jgi:hypothetical protein
MGIQWYSMTAHQIPFEPCRKAGWSIETGPRTPVCLTYDRFTLIYSLVNNPDRSPRQTRSEQETWSNGSNPLALSLLDRGQHESGPAYFQESRVFGKLLWPVGQGGQVTDNPVFKPLYPTCSAPASPHYPQLFLRSSSVSMDLESQKAERR